MVELTGAVLAGGRSRRFGTNKALFAVGGQTMLERSIALLQPLCGEVLLSASAENAGAYASLGIKTVPDGRAGCGPVGGLETLLTVAEGSWLLVLTCDMPFISPATLQELLRHCHEGRQAVAFRLADGSKMPFPLLIGKDALPAVKVQMAADNLRMKALLERLDCLWLKAEDAGEFANINRMEDLSPPQ